jgi:hypothetical protein
MNSALLGQFPRQGTKTKSVLEDYAAILTFIHGVLQELERCNQKSLHVKYKVPSPHKRA